MADPIRARNGHSGVVAQEVTASLPSKQNALPKERVVVRD
jgi:hypothetical protein